MIRLTKKFLALSALAVAFSSATAEALPMVTVSFVGRTGDEFKYEVTATPDGQDLVFDAGDTIRLLGVSSAAVASYTVPTFPNFSPFFVGSVAPYTTLTFTASANDFSTSSTVKGTFSIFAVAGATEGTGEYATIFHDETGVIGRNSGALTIPVAPIVPTNGVPEPSTVALAAVGLVGAAFARRKRKA